MSQLPITHEAVVSQRSAPPAGPYSPAVRVGDLLFVSGQGPFGPDGALRGGDDFEAQVNATFDNIEALAAEVGASLAHVVRLGAYLSDQSYFQRWNAVCTQRLSAPYPARTTVALALPGFDIEIDAVIAIPPADSVAAR